MAKLDVNDIFGALKSSSIDPGVFEKIDERDFEKAPNFISWVTSPKFLNTSVLPRQVEMATKLMTEWCPRCSKPGYINTLFDQSLGNIRDNIIFLEHGICPKCKVTRYELVTKGESRLYTELVNRAGQRCVEKGTLVYTPGGLVRMEDLNAGDRITTGIVTETFSSGETEVIKATTAHNYSFKGAAETHRVATLNSDFQIEHKLMKDLELGDTLLLHSPDSWPKSRYQLPKFSREITPGTYNTKSFPFPTEVTPELARLIGYAISDGQYSKKWHLRIVSSNDDVAEDIKRCCLAVFGEEPRLEDKRVNKLPGYSYKCWSVAGIAAMEWLKHIGLPPATRRDKVIPDFILKSPKDIVGEFLAGLFGGDGCITKYRTSKTIRVQYTSVSKVLVYQLRLLLLNMGIVSSCSKLRSNGFGKASSYGEEDIEFGKESYFLAFKDARDVQTFRTYVRLVEKRKVSILESPGSRDNPVYWLPKGQTKVMRQFPVGPAKKITAARLSATPDEFSRLIGEGYRPVPITKLKTVRCKEMVDISVADSNCYIASGFLSHNSGKSKLVGLLSTYVLHRILKITNPLRYYGQPSGEILQATFSALNDESCKENLWEPTRGFIDSSPWFESYHNFLKAEGKRLSTELYRPLVKSMFYSHKRIFLHYTGAKATTMRGKTRFMAAVDEIGWMVSDETKSLQLMDADAVYTALSNSLATLRAANNQLWGPDCFDLPPMLMSNSSSPSSAKDKISRLEKDAEANPKILAMHLATWESNPAYDYDSLRSEFAHMSQADFMRDFGAEPPLESNPFIQEPRTVDKIAREPTPSVSVKVVEVEDSFGDTSRSMLPVFEGPQDKRIPRLLSLDLGWKKNALSICMFSLGPDGAIRLDFGFSLWPKPKTMIDLAHVFDNFTVALVKQYNVKFAYFDRWQSLDQVSRLRALKVDAGLHSLTYKEMDAVRGTVTAQGVTIPKMLKPLASYVEDYKRNIPIPESDPSAILGLQLLTVRDTGTKFLKPIIGDDDIFRAFCLGVVMMQSEHVKKEFAKGAKAILGGNSVQALGSLRLRSSGAVVSSGSGAALLDDGRALGVLKPRSAARISTNGQGQPGRKSLI